MELYFLRHGLAGQHGDPKYKDDSLRPLTAEGRDKLLHAARGMKVMGLKFDVVCSSPYLRARQSAEIVAQAYKIKSKEICLTNNLLPPSTIEKLLKEIQDRFPKSRDILLVGHEPHLTEMVSSLLNCDGPLSIDFKKGGLCCLSIEQPLSQPPNATLNWLFTSTQLGLLGKK